MSNKNLQKLKIYKLKLKKKKIYRIYYIVVFPT